jgi:hypothetical protein
MAKASTHEHCTHEASPRARNRCRRVGRLVEEYRENPETNKSLREALDGESPVKAMGWLVEHQQSGPVMITYEGTLERSYQHRDGFTVWVIVSDQKPQGTGHLACQVRIIEE